ncbi:hypothetical protein ACVMAJ_003580 [Bradyrhizobium sp. USDA 4448]
MSLIRGCDRHPAAGRAPRRFRTLQKLRHCARRRDDGLSRALTPEGCTCRSGRPLLPGRRMDLARRRAGRRLPSPQASIAAKPAHIAGRWPRSAGKLGTGLAHGVTPPGQGLRRRAASCAGRARSRAGAGVGASRRDAEQDSKYTKFKGFKSRRLEFSRIRIPRTHFLRIGFQGLNFKDSNFGRRVLEIESLKLDCRHFEARPARSGGRPRWHPAPGVAGGRGGAEKEDPTILSLRRGAARAAGRGRRGVAGRQRRGKPRSAEKHRLRQDQMIPAANVCHGTTT